MGTQHDQIGAFLGGMAGDAAGHIALGHVVGVALHSHPPCAQPRGHALQVGGGLNRAGEMALTMYGHGRAPLNYVQQHNSGPRLA